MLRPMAVTLPKFSEAKLQTGSVSGSIVTVCVCGIAGTWLGERKAAGCL